MLTISIPRDKNNPRRRIVFTVRRNVKFSIRSRVFTADSIFRVTARGTMEI